MSKGVLAALAVLLAGCASPGESTPTFTPIDCGEPPAAALAVESPVDIRVSPNPASPRQQAELTVPQGDFDDDAVVGVDAAWQCWDGSAWVTTHIVYRGFGDRAGQTIPINTDFQIRVPAIGLSLDDGFPIVIPQVDPGTYRIEDEVLADETITTGFTVVEVAEG